MKPGDTRPLRRRRKSRRGRLLRPILWGCATLPSVIGVAMFVGLLTAQAMYREELAQAGEAVLSLLEANGLMPPVPTATLSPPDETQVSLALEATLAAYTPPPTATREPTRTPTRGPSPTASATPSATATETATPTATETATPTPTFTDTPTATLSPTASATPSRTPTRTATATYRPWPTWTSTPRPSATPTSPPSPTVPPGSVAPSPTSTPFSTSCTTTINTAFENEVVQLVNDERAANGLYAYRVQSQLRAAARVQAADMACNHFTGHTGSDGSNVRDRVEAQGYSWSWIGENYMVTGDTANGPQVAFNWWMNSAPHTANILSPNYTEFGVGYIYSPESDYGGYFVIVFARPR